jgi:protein-tyrosine-phosphatase
MKVLFVCRANVGRSQAAMEFYNQLVPGDGASAGTIVEKPGEKLKERFSASTIVAVMKEHGADMNENYRTQITREMLDQYEKVVVMAEPETIPEWLSESPKFIYWNIVDAKGKSLTETRDIAAEIKEKVENLVKGTN